MILVLKSLLSFNWLSFYMKKMTPSNNSIQNYEFNLKTKTFPKSHFETKSRVFGNNLHRFVFQFTEKCEVS